MRDPTPTATARITNRNLNEDERASRQAILKAVDQRKFMGLALTKSVAKGDQAAGAAGEKRIVRDQHQRGSFALVQRDQKFENMLAVLAVEIAGGFVGQQDGRPHHEGAGQGDALLFASGELDGIMIAAVSQADAFEQFARAGAAGWIRCRRSDRTAAGHFLRRLGWAADDRTGRRIRLCGRAAGPCGLRRGR